MLCAARLERVQSKARLSSDRSEAPCEDARLSLVHSARERRPQAQKPAPAPSQRPCNAARKALSAAPCPERVEPDSASPQTPTQPPSGQTTANQPAQSEGRQPQAASPGQCKAGVFASDGQTLEIKRESSE